LFDFDLLTIQFLVYSPCLKDMFDLRFTNIGCGFLHLGELGTSTLLEPTGFKERKFAVES
jgi:hypothetical protein